MVTELIRGVNHFHSLLDKPIKLEICHKSSWRSSQLERKTENAKTEVNFSLYTPLLPLSSDNQAKKFETFQFFFSLLYRRFLIETNFHSFFTNLLVILSEALHPHCII